MVADKEGINAIGDDLQYNTINERGSEQKLDQGQAQEEHRRKAASHLATTLLRTRSCLLRLLHGLCPGGLPQNQTIKADRPFGGRIHSLRQVQPTLLFLESLARPEGLGLL